MKMFEKISLKKSGLTLKNLQIDYGHGSSTLKLMIQQWMMINLQKSLSKCQKQKQRLLDLHRNLFCGWLDGRQLFWGSSYFNSVAHHFEPVCFCWKNMKFSFRLEGKRKSRGFPKNKKLYKKHSIRSEIYQLTTESRNKTIFNSTWDLQFWYVNKLVNKLSGRKPIQIHYATVHQSFD